MNAYARYVIFLLVLFLGFSSCKEEPKKKGVPTLEEMDAPAFKAGSAYALIEKQLAFGHRIPGTDSHVACKDFFVDYMSQFANEVRVQEFEVSFLNVKNAKAFNIISSFNPGATKRILLAAHWDSRLIAEKDPVPEKKNQPIMGADDGASGIAVLMEIARILHENPLSNLGVDMVFFDAEDQGGGGNMTWCLGSQYWSKNPIPANYSADYGVLLDMVGAKGAKFGYETISESFASNILKKVWGLAAFLGHDDVFVKTRVGQIDDDHVYVIQNLRIPMIDIINRPLNTPHGFGAYHHTHNDNIDIIDQNILGKVGEVMTQLLYREDKGKI